MNQDSLLGRLATTRIGRGLATAALVAGIGLGSTLLPATASAATLTGTANLRPCVDLANANCSPVGTTGSSGIDKLRCWRDGSWATGRYRSDRWFLAALKDGREGYVHSSVVTDQYSTPNCSTLAYVRAADWAIGQIGRTQAPDNWAPDYSDWNPGPYAEWSGDCAKFAHMAFTHAAGVGFETGDAIVMYRKYANRGLISTDLPRYGDPVFYDTAKPYGHVAIYIGGTTIVSTQGMDFAGLPVARRDIDSFPNRLGWAAV